MKGWHSQSGQVKEGLECVRGSQPSVPGHAAFLGSTLQKDLLSSPLIAEEIPLPSSFHLPTGKYHNFPRVPSWFSFSLHKAKFDHHRSTVWLRQQCEEPLKVALKGEGGNTKSGCGASFEQASKVLNVLPCFPVFTTALFLLVFYC